MHSAAGIPFESVAQRDALERLRAPIAELFPGKVQERIHAIGFVARLPEVVTATLSPRGDDEVSIGVRSYLAGAVPMTPDVLRELGRWTSEIRFGVFGVDDADNVYFEEQLLASTATPAQIGESMRSVLRVVAARTGEFRSRFGGTDL